MAASSNQRDFHPMFVGSAKRLQISIRNMKLRVEQSAIDVDGKQANGKSH